jgi:uncharacterized protein (UPF0212 family)
MANNVQIKFDIDNKSLEIAGQETMKVTQQIRLLKAELAKGSLSAKEFEIVASKVGELEDGLAKTKARSGDLLTTLQLVPGPIGEISSKLNGTIALLKTFSGFKLKDLKFQLKETLDDVKDIATAFGKATGITKIYTTLNNALAQSFVKVGIGEQAAATGAKAFSAALVTTGVGILVVALGMAVNALMDFASSSDEAEQQQKELGDQIARVNTLLDMDMADAARRQKVRLAELRASGASEKTIREQGVKDLKENLNLTSAALDEARKLENTAQGKGVEALREAQKNTLALEGKQKELISNIRVAELDNVTQHNKDLQTQRTKNQGDSQKAAQAEKQFQQQKLADQKSALDAQIEQEISLTNTSTTKLEELYKKRNKFDLDELKNAETNAKNLLSQKKITGEEYNNIIAGIEAKRILIAQKTTEGIKKASEDDQKVVEENKKKDEEAIKNTEEFNRKIRDLKTSSILDDNARDKQARTDKYDDDLKALEQDAEFVKKSETEKAEIRKNLKVVFNREIEKIDETQREKDYEEDRKAGEKRLRLLELQGQGLVQGTKSYFVNRKAVLDETQKQETEELTKQYEKGKLTKEEYEKALTSTESKYVNLRKELKKQELAAVGQTISATLDAFANLGNAIASTYDEEAKTSQAAFEKRKKLQLATAVASAASGLVQILTQPSTLPSPFDWIVKGINAVALGVATKVNIDKIKATKFEAPDSGGTGGAAPYSVTANRASGGIVTGAGTSTSDSINARLSNGEYVVNARATSAFLPLLNSINDAGLQPRFAAGGLYTGQDSGNFAAENITRAIQDSIIDRPMRTYVVGTDMSNQQQFDRTIKSRSVI